MYQGYKLAIVVPAYNEEAFIAETLENMPPEADRVYVVDDASTDATRQIVKTFVNGKIRLLGNGHNRGVGSAIVAGYKKALEEDMDIAVVMAGDNQMDKKYLPGLLSPIIQGKADYTKGNRLSCFMHTKGMSTWRLFGNWILTLLTNIASGYWRIGDPQNGYTAITREALKRIDLDKVYPHYGYCNDLLVKLNVSGCKVVDVPIPARYGNEKSKIKYNEFITKVSYLLLRGFLWRLGMKIFHNRGMCLDFTINKYRQLCNELHRYGYTSSTVAAYLENHNEGQKIIVFRHDVDRKPQRALRMARVEYELGIKATYYFRFNKNVFQPHLIREIASMGHEIGYHYETLDKAKGSYERAIQIFRDELAKAREVTEVRTICMHGNPLTKWGNRDLWSKYDFRDFGLVGEAYLSFGDITYFSDTGRTWSSKNKVKDVLPSAVYAGVEKVGGHNITNTDSLIELIKSGKIEPIYILVHPERWSNSLASWLTDLTLDTGVNLGKRILTLLKRGTKLQGTNGNC